MNNETKQSVVVTAHRNYYTYHIFQTKYLPHVSSFDIRLGGLGRARTDDTRVAISRLNQLSY